MLHRIRCSKHQGTEICIRLGKLFTWQNHQSKAQPSRVKSTRAYTERLVSNYLQYVDNCVCVFINLKRFCWSFHSILVGVLCTVMPWVSFLVLVMFSGRKVMCSKHLVSFKQPSLWLNDKLQKASSSILFGQKDDGCYARPQQRGSKKCVNLGGPLVYPEGLEGKERRFQAFVD